MLRNRGSGRCWCRWRAACRCSTAVSRASAVAVLRPRWTTSASARTAPVSRVIGRRYFTSRAERGVADAGRKRGVDGAAERRVEQRRGVAAVDDADRVVVLLAGLALEDGPALLDLDRSQKFIDDRDRRRRQLARLDRAACSRCPAISPRRPRSAPGPARRGCGCARLGRAPAKARRVDRLRRAPSGARRSRGSAASIGRPRLRSRRRRLARLRRVSRSARISSELIRTCSGMELESECSHVATPSARVGCLKQLRRARPYQRELRDATECAKITLVLGNEYEGQICSIARSLELVGERWTLLVVRESSTAGASFAEMQQHLGVARNVLTSRLQRLVDEDILERRPYSERPERYEYFLTEKGLDLWPVMIALMQLGRQVRAAARGPSLDRRPQGRVRRRDRRSPDLHQVRQAADGARGPRNRGSRNEGGPRAASRPPRSRAS